MQRDIVAIIGVVQSVQITEEREMMQRKAMQHIFVKRPERPAGQDQDEPWPERVTPKRHDREHECDRRRDPEVGEIGAAAQPEAIEQPRWHRDHALA